jgi:hypothetical protein
VDYVSHLLAACSSSRRVGNFAWLPDHPLAVEQCLAHCRCSQYLHRAEEDGLQLWISLADKDLHSPSGGLQPPLSLAALLLHCNSPGRHRPGPLSDVVLPSPLIRTRWSLGCDTTEHQLSEVSELPKCSHYNLSSSS